MSIGRRPCVIHFDPNAFLGDSNSFASPQSSPSPAYAIGAGINWYMNQNFKIQLNTTIRCVARKLRSCALPAHGQFGIARYQLTVLRRPESSAICARNPHSRLILELSIA